MINRYVIELENTVNQLIEAHSLNHTQVMQELKSRVTKILENPVMQRLQKPSQVISLGLCAMLSIQLLQDVLVDSIRDKDPNFLESALQKTQERIHQTLSKFDEQTDVDPKIKPLNWFY